MYSSCSWSAISSELSISTRGLVIISVFAWRVLRGEGGERRAWWENVQCAGAGSVVRREECRHLHTSQCSVGLPGHPHVTQRIIQGRLSTQTTDWRMYLRFRNILNFDLIGGSRFRNVLQHLTVHCLQFASCWLEYCRSVPYRQVTWLFSGWYFQSQTTLQSN